MVGGAAHRLTWTRFFWFARVAAGVARRGLTLGRSVLRPTALRYSPRGRVAELTTFALLSAFKQPRRECLRSALRAPTPGLRSSAPQRSPPPGNACREQGCWLSAMNSRDISGKRVCAQAAARLWCVEKASPGHKQSSGRFVPGEQQGHWPGAACKARACGQARSAVRQHFRRGCLNGESEANKVSSATWPQDRASQKSRAQHRPQQ